MMLVKNKEQKIRFAIVGAANTAIDFSLFLTLGLGGTPAIVANYVSTTVALLISFFANKHYTFQNNEPRYFRQLALFVTFTAFGLWVIQPIVILLAERALSGVTMPEWLLLTSYKILATLATLVWNYVTYSRFVFKKREDTIGI